MEYAQRYEEEEEEEIIEEQQQIAEPVEIKEPEHNPFFVRAPLIARIDMDILKLTAQFVARNGQKFLMGLTDRESKNPQFDFLKPTHALFEYFTSLVEAYSRCLLPKREDITKLQQNIVSKESILQRCLDKFHYENQKIKARKPKEQIEEEERQQMTMIDWHDFVVVETIELNDNEELPPPSEPSLVHTLDSGYTKLEEDGKRRGRESLDTGRRKKRQVDTGIGTDISNYTQKCPICGNMIPVDDFPDHIKLEMLDPAYKRQKEEARIKEKQTVYASSNEIFKNLKNLAAQRPDLVNPEAPIGEIEQSFSLGGKSDDFIPAKKLIGENKPEQPKEPKIPESVLKVAKELRKDVLGLRDVDSRETLKETLEPESPAEKKPFDIEYKPQPSVVQPLAGPSYQAAAVMEKSNYRLNEEHSTLVPETQWAKMYPNPININIKVPEEEAYDEDWGLRGQIIQLSVDIIQTIQSVKSTLSNILGGMPVLRMKLKTNLHSVLKDNESLAKYNISPGSVIELAVKERGGRRKY